MRDDARRNTLQSEGRPRVAYGRHHPRQPSPDARFARNLWHGRIVLAGAALVDFSARRPNLENVLRDLHPNAGYDVYRAYKLGGVVRGGHSLRRSHRARGDVPVGQALGTRLGADSASHSDFERRGLLPARFSLSVCCMNASMTSDRPPIFRERKVREIYSLQ